MPSRRRRPQPQDTPAETATIWVLGIALSLLSLYLIVQSTWIWGRAAHSAWFGVRAGADRGLALQYGAMSVAPLVIAVVAALVGGRRRDYVVKWAWAMGAGSVVGLVLLIPATL